MKLTITTTFIAASMFALPISVSGVALGMIDHGHGNQANNKGGECTTFVHHSFEDVGVTPVVTGRCVSMIPPHPWEVAALLYRVMKLLWIWKIKNVNSIIVSSARAVMHVMELIVLRSVVRVSVMPHVMNCHGENSCVGEVACSVSKGEFNLNNE